MKNRPLLSVCLMILVVIATAVLWGGEKFIRELRPSPLEKNTQEEEILTVRGRVYQIEQKETYQALYLKDNSIQSENQSFQESKIIIYTDTDLQLHIGNEITAQGEVAFFDNARNPGNFDQKLYYQRMDIHGMIWASVVKVTDSSCWKFKDGLQELRMKWKEILKEILGEKEGSILSAVMLGDKNGMDQEVKNLYQLNGIGHILAISGLHLSFIGLGIYRMLRKLSGSYLAGGIGGVLFLSLYIAMIGLSVSVVRAFIMFLFRVGADIAGAHYDMGTAIASAAVVALCWRPLYLLDGGFWMSFGACLAVASVLPFFQELPLQAFWGSISIQAVLLPVLFYFFFEIPPYSMVLNLYVIPLMSVLLFLGMLGSVLYGILVPAAEVLLKACGWILQLYEKSCTFVISLPGARIVTGQPKLWQIGVYYILLAATLGMLKYQSRKKKLEKAEKKKRVYVAATLFWMLGFCVLIHRFGETGTLKVTMLDVGQGDCLFVKGPSGGSYLIDGGSSDVKEVGCYRIEPFLKSQGVRKLDYVFISHGDSDHMNGVEELIEREKLGVEIGTLVLPVREMWDESLQELAEEAAGFGIRVMVMEPGQKIQEQDMMFLCIQPEAEDKMEKGNEASMVLSLHYGAFDMLFTGDVEAEGEENLTHTLKEQYSDTVWEVLKTAHHGSKNSSSEKFLTQVVPKYALISAGRNNMYGHPHAETLERLDDAGCKVYSTQESGAVFITVKKNVMTVELN